MGPSRRTGNHRPIQRAGPSTIHVGSNSDHGSAVSRWEKSTNMGPLTPIVALAVTLSFGEWVQFDIAIGIAVLSYWATVRIITQAGYSQWWIILPLAPFVLTIISFIVLWHDLNAIIFGGSVGFFGVESVGFIWHLDQLSFVLNWIFFLVFAFSRWPVSGTRPSTEGNALRSSSPATSDMSSPTSGPAVPRGPLPVTRAIPSSRVAPVTGPAGSAITPSPPRPSAQYCAWCGESLPGNRALFHDCGTKDRPETNCKICGAAFPSGSSQCGSCATT
jgi:hypothetical protein